MKFEHKTERVVPLRQFYKRVWRFALFAMFLIALSLGIGIAGYHYIRHLDFVDSLYMSSMILTGMGPVGDLPMLDDHDKIFSSAYALYSGVAFLSICAVFFAPIIHRFLHILQVESDDNDTKNQ